MTSSRSDQPTLGYLPAPVLHQSRSTSPGTNQSPTEPVPGSAVRSPFSFPGGLSSVGKMAGTSRSGAGSPSHDLGSTIRPFSKRYVKVLFTNRIIIIDALGMAELERSRLKKAFQSMSGDRQPVETQPLSARTYLSRPRMDFPSSHNYLQPRAYRRPVVLVLAPYHLASLLEDRLMDSVLFLP